MKTAGKPSPLRRLMSIILAILGGFLLSGLLVRLFENRLVYFPTPFPADFDGLSHYGLNWEDVFLKTTDEVRIHGWFRSAPESPAAILFLHGNAGNLTDRLGHLQILSLLGTNMLAIDYRGYGNSEGSPDEEGVYRDADAAYRYLIEDQGLEPGRIFIHGHSLGGSVAVDLAARKPCGGLILSGTFTRGREMARRIFRIPFLEYFPKTRFDSLEKLRRVIAPVLVIHGTEDAVVPFAMAPRLYEAARGPKFFFPVEGAGHDDLYLVAGEDYLHRLREFFTSSSQAAKTVQQ